METTLLAYLLRLQPCFRNKFLRVGILSLKVSFKNGVFVWTGKYEERGIPLKTGFVWSPITRRWETSKLSKAARLRDHFDKSAEEQIEANSVKVTPWPGELSFIENQTLRDFQVKGVHFALTRNHSYLAFEQGLGKTPTAVCIINEIALPTVVVCPPFLIDNWKREIERWGMGGRVGVIDSGKKITADLKTDLWLVPDTLLDKPVVKHFMSTLDLGLAIIDEAQRFSNPDAKRTAALFDHLLPSIPKIVLLSGTPMRNRPMELWQVLSKLAHDAIKFMSVYEFGAYFCAGFEAQHGWDYTGASNEDELAERLHEKFMLRFMKIDVAQELKPKEERIVLLSGTVPKNIQKMEQGLVNKSGHKISHFTGDASMGAIAEYRRELGMAKLPLVIEYVSELLKQGECILFGGWHTEFLQAMANHFVDRNPAYIDGSTSKHQRTLEISDFQNGKTNLFICQIQCAVGWNAQRANRAVVAEPSWVPGDNDQFTDRAHRIGQENTVVVDYLCLANTLDEYQVERLLEKQATINRVINRR